MEKNKLETAATEREEMEALEALAGAEGGEDTEPEDLVLRFGKPYKFGGQEYTEVDLSGLEDTTAGDLARCAKITTRKHKGLNTATLEMTTEYSITMAHIVTKLPLEFFERMPSKSAIELKGIVVGFLFGADGVD
ncbi:phage tail assembly protein [uncultured Oscillibacter sp.]|uniref:phage tail assembly protein n=1 Tax=uncultured Oscillibacter sp. TaxID=876091 RepID=UPI0026105FE3|nr:phage tail assembly protein [uncultured Oscillibacter sp.]